MTAPDPTGATVDGQDDREMTVWQVVAQRDALAAQVATLTAERDRLAQDYVRVMTERDNAVGELAERTRERDADGEEIVRLVRARDQARSEALHHRSDAASLRHDLDLTSPVVEAAIAWRGLFVGEIPTDVAYPIAEIDLFRTVERYQHPAVTVSPDAPSHVYLSTACHHGEHAYCAGTTRQDGNPKTPAQCKFCGAGCVCGCGHPEPDATQPVAHEHDLAVLAVRCSCGKLIRLDTPAAPLSSSEPAPQPHTEARPPATGGIVQPGTWLIGEPRDVPSMKLSWGEAAAVARDGLLDMEARRTALAAREAVETVVAGPRKVFTTSSLTAGPAESDGTTGRTGALEAGVAAALAVYADHGLDEDEQTDVELAAANAVRAAAPLIEREALLSVAKGILADAADVERQWQTGHGDAWDRGYVAGMERAAHKIANDVQRADRARAASLVVTAEGEDRG